MKDPNARQVIVNDLQREDDAREEDLAFFDDYLGNLILKLKQFFFNADIFFNLKGQIHQESGVLLTATWTTTRLLKMQYFSMSQLS